jgi:regulator of protease activity HflC (stomatin/prohibitin superfamily)
VVTTVPGASDARAAISTRLRTDPARVPAVRFQTGREALCPSYDHGSDRQVEIEIRQEVVQKMEGKHVAVNGILIREVHLPPVVQMAIQQKLQEEQKSLEMKYVLDRTRQEAERARLEAAGIADFQAIVSKGLDDRFLEWKGIDATEKLANSPNTKVIIVGSGKNGLPVILNAGSSDSETAPRSRPSESGTASR